eukprot:TRINITY_DN45010_c0_g1_i1.p1 TRINITY_DN45010_c0_g1~~TRINITY_DN45010_c0_g1_i1.p1  ORF type:complete len:489 (+),score=71.52 TRINITY_DN45010_c0_g1_i1:21-1487(+)
MADTVDSDRVREYSEPDEATFERKLDALAQLMKHSKYTVFYTGAGVSTSAGVGDYRGPTGAWTMRKIKQLQRKRTDHSITPAEAQELEKLLLEVSREEKKATKKVDMLDAEPTATHMAMSTLIRHGIAHFVVTTNLDGLYRKAGLVDHQTAVYLHGDVYIERCTGCGYEYERNYHTRQDSTHVHDHKLGKCERCGSSPPAHYKGEPGSAKMKGSKWGGVMIGTRDTNCGTKDTHINFGECLDSIDWDDAEDHCRKADLCIVAGTSMSLRHITHMPFLAKKVVIINLQATPDDDKANLRIWAKCDPVFVGLMERFGLEIDPVPVWRPRDAVPIAKIPKWVHPYYVEAAKRLEKYIQGRLLEEQTRAADHIADLRISPHQAAPRLLIGNLHRTVQSEDSNTHEWTMFVRSEDNKPLSGLVDHVEFQLHPTFRPNKVTVTEEPYELQRLGWGTFEIGVVVHWRDTVSRAPSRFVHALSFSAPETASTHPAW